MYDDVGAASGVGHDIFQWLHVIQMPGTTFESLADSRGRPTLDVKLGSALRKLLKGDLKQQVQTKAKALERQGRMLRGRQILWLTSQQYALDETLPVAHTHTHDGGRGIVKENKRREKNIEKEKGKGK